MTAEFIKLIYIVTILSALTACTSTHNIYHHNNKQPVSVMSPEKIDGEVEIKLNSGEIHFVIIDSIDETKLVAGDRVYYMN